MMNHTKGSRANLSFLTDSLWERARQREAEGEHAAAVALYQRLADIDPKSVMASLKLAHHLVEVGQGGRAAAEYVRLAGIYARQGHPERAMTVTLRALHLDPSRVIASRLAPVVQALGPEAARLCERVSRIHLLAGRPAEAREVLSVLVRCEPSVLSRRLRLAELYLAEGRVTEAMAELRIVADGLRSHGRTQELVRVLEMMHAHGGANEAVLRELASVYVRCGQPRRARVKLEALHRIVPDDRPTVEHLARVHASLGQLELTLRLLERLVVLIEAQTDRGELRAMLRRAATWCSDASYLRALETLGLRALASGGVGSTEPPRPRSLPRGRARRRTPPPPLPAWMRRHPRTRASAGEIQVLDDLDSLPEDRRASTDAGILRPEDVVLLSDVVVTRAGRLELLEHAVAP